VGLLAEAELAMKNSSLMGLAAVLLASLSWSVGVVISPRLRLPADALARTAIPLVCGAVMLLIAAAVSGEFQRTQWSNISLRSVVGLVVGHLADVQPMCLVVLSRSRRSCFW
jgi:drug/metabolite transporter (DMT)-like permease